MVGGGTRVSKSSVFGDVTSPVRESIFRRSLSCGLIGESGAIVKVISPAGPGSLSVTSTWKMNVLGG